MYKLIIRPILFLIKPETAHNFIFSYFRIVSKIPYLRAILRVIYSKKNPLLNRKVAGIDFSNPIGLAAGLDKNAEAFDLLGDLGFGFVEIGTITPEGQPGNPKPRLFRLPKNQALINRMGFNNEGVGATVKRLKKKKSNVIIGGNIGKNKLTPNEKALDDYEKSFDALYAFVDYFVVNVSSPNTPNLRELQEKKPLSDLLSHLQQRNLKTQHAKPIFLKIAPDLSWEQIDDIIEIVETTKIAGIVATNTTISRQGLDYENDFVAEIGAGGLSGKPLRERSTEIIRYIHEKSKGKFPIIGVGGIMTADDALKKLEAGASLVQIYTGFIYEGPALIKKINKKILAAANATNVKK